MLPSASSINNGAHLTKEFRQALIQVIYDALRFKLKPMVIQAAQKAMEYEQRGTSDEDQEEDPGPSEVTQRPKRSLKEGHSIPATRVEPVNNDLAGLKMLDLLATRPEPHEDKIQYLKRVWPRLKSNDCSEAAKRLWIGKVTGIHIDCNDTAQAHYDRIVVTVEVDEEEELMRFSVATTTRPGAGTTGGPAPAERTTTTAAAGSSRTQGRWQNRIPIIRRIQQTGCSRKRRSPSGKRKGPRRAPAIMESKTKAVMEGAYWVGKTPYTMWRESPT